MLYSHRRTTGNDENRFDFVRKIVLDIIHIINCKNSSVGKSTSHKIHIECEKLCNPKRHEDCSSYGNIIHRVV